MRLLLPLLALLVVAFGLWAFMRTRRVGKRQLAIRRLLDAADALEIQLRAARSEIEAVAGDHENPVRQAMQDLLRQRLWLKENAETASLKQLDGVRQSLDAARTRIEAQLQQIDAARSATQ